MKYKIDCSQCPFYLLRLTVDKYAMHGCKIWRCDYCKTFHTTFPSIKLEVNFGKERTYLPCKWPHTIDIVYFCFKCKSSFRKEAGVTVWTWNKKEKYFGRHNNV